MESMFKQIAIIKEEYGCTSKELQMVSRSTARFNDSVQKMEISIHEMQQEIEEASRHLILSQLEVDDAEVNKQRLKEQLEVAKARHAETKAALNAQEDIRDELAKEVSTLKSPEDYRQELLSTHERLQLRRKELAAEQELSTQLQTRLTELKEASEKKIQLGSDIEKLKQLRTSVLTEIATLDRKHERLQDPKQTIRQLEEQLQEAQDRFQYLCSHQMMMQ